MKNTNRWALIDPHTGRCREFAYTDPAGKYHASLRWIPVQAELSQWADYEYIEQEGQIVPPSLDYLKNQIAQEVTSIRWQHETGGLTLPNGVRILTTKNDQDRVNAVLTNMERYAVTEVDFKTASGWVRASYENVKAIGAAMMQHVQACFTAEKAHHDAIDALASIETVTSYDYATGWPGNEA